jgi:hypothetical protein
MSAEFEESYRISSLLHTLILSELLSQENYSRRPCKECHHKEVVFSIDHKQRLTHNPGYYIAALSYCLQISIANLKYSERNHRTTFPCM